MDAIQGAPVPEIESNLEKMDTPDASGPIQPSTEADHKVVKSSTPGVRCPTCALEGKEVWVLPGRCCGYCGTPSAIEDTLSLDAGDSFPNIDLHEDSPLFPTTGTSDEQLPPELSIEFIPMS
jgi:hypothetical protein